MVEITGFTPREYQERIVTTSKANNTLVCLPTGTGKTKTAILVAVARLNQFPKGKVLVCSPTKPLTNQIAEEFKACTTLQPGEVSVLTGTTSPLERVGVWKRAKVIVATPQTIENDLTHKRISLENVVLLCIDECHRSKMKFANTGVTKIYKDQAHHERIMALTASPGSTKESIKEICENLFIDAVEIRTEEDDDIKEHIQGKKIEFVKVELPPTFLEVKELLRNLYLNKVKQLRSFGLTKPAGIVNKRDLLGLQFRLQQQIKQRNTSAFIGVSMVAQAIKTSYLAELVETQTIQSAKLYIQKLEKETSKAAKTIMNTTSMKEAIIKINALAEDNCLHPKLVKLQELIKQEIAENKECRIIVFANFRNTVDEITKLLNKNNTHAKKFVGQANKETKGLKQSEQIALLDEFRNSEFNVLVASSVGEEGLDIPEVQAVIFYEPVPSELRRTQRSGRTGRTKPGKVIYLVTKNTRDEAYHWSSQKKQKLMKETLYKMKEEQFTL